MAEYSQDNYGNYYRDGEQISSSEYHHAKAQYDAQSASNIKNLLIAAAAIAFIYVLVVWTVTIVVCILIFFPVIIALIKGLISLIETVSYHRGGRSLFKVFWKIDFYTISNLFNNYPAISVIFFPVVIWLFFWLILAGNLYIIPAVVLFAAFIIISFPLCILIWLFELAFLRKGKSQDMVSEVSASGKADAAEAVCAHSSQGNALLAEQYSLFPGGNDSFSFNWIFWSAAIAAAFAISFFYSFILADKLDLTSSFDRFEYTIGLFDGISTNYYVFFNHLIFLEYTGILLLLLWFALTPVCALLIAATECAYIYNVSVKKLNVPSIMEYVEKNTSYPVCRYVSSKRNSGVFKVPYIVAFVGKYVDPLCYLNEKDYKKNKIGFGSFDIVSYEKQLLKEQKVRQSSQAREKALKQGKEIETKEKSLKKENEKINKNNAAQPASGTANLSLSEKLSAIKTKLNSEGYKVSADGRIVQCRGYCNDRGKDKPLTVLAFEKEYQVYLDEIFNKRRKTA